MYSTKKLSKKNNVSQIDWKRQLRFSAIQNSPSHTLAITASFQALPHQKSQLLQKLQPMLMLMPTLMLMSMLTLMPMLMLVKLNSQQMNPRENKKARSAPTAKPVSQCFQDGCANRTKCAEHSVMSDKLTCKIEQLRNKYGQLTDSI